MLMKNLVIAVATFFVCFILFKVLRFVWSEIKRDPVTNLLIPAATALLTNLLLWLL